MREKSRTVTLPPSVLAPARLPNAGPGPTAALLKTLKDNHERSHVVFNDYSFINHAAHHLLAIWALGASGPLITAAYEDTHLDHMRDAFQAPDRVVISDDNFHDYLGDENYYNAYLDYFRKVVLAPGATISSTLEKYIFSSEYNINTSLAPGKQQPEMLNRFVEQVIHALIHAGYGAEFKLPGMLVEGLAQTSIRPARRSALVSRLLFPGNPDRPKSHVHALTILSHMLADSRFWTHILKKHEFKAMMVSHGELINSYAEMWTCEINSQDDFSHHLEELVWASTVMYGVSSWDGESDEYRADFFTMHIVTSCLFLPSLCAHLSYKSQSLLLRAHFLASITWWLVRGRGAVPLRKFFAAPLAPLPSPAHFKYATTLPGVLPQPAACALLGGDSPHVVTPNVWYPVLQNAIVHPNEHLCKCQRALAHFAVLYGHREAGFMSEVLSSSPAVSCPDTPLMPGGLELPEGECKALDAPEWEFLDGSLFLRVAWLTSAALGWVREGEPNKGIWDYQEFLRHEIEAKTKP
ncbi:hypothetical protein DEU56DRAFT_918116 [Suillus clintonianus]|uniref:uncharacterized protein n=1 Tax=Suillus clintonianus TaxID=1904413 RepID=UPI001B87E34A|nr:uncharacterized protein DEU56DRAFT_918116 [Suillus clintonianus]KAG2121595.1 hypothetical protein DEU56DRAFT_918116 [Suillus clintonianus]